MLLCPEIVTDLFDIAPSNCTAFCNHPFYFASPKILVAKQQKTFLAI